MRFKKTLAALGGGAALVAVTALPAHAAYNDGVIRAVSFTDGGLGICKNWSGSASDPGCASGSPRGTLARNENSKSKYGWVDTDGAILSPGCDLYKWEGDFSTLITRNTGSNSKEVKITGFYGETKHLEERC